MSVLRKFSLLLIIMPAALTVSLLSPITDQMYTEFANYPETLITMTISMPSLSMLIGLMLSPILMKKVPAKILVLVGLLMFSICLFLPALGTGLYLTLFLRMLGGIGCGLIMPLQSTYAATYPEDERASIMGLSTVCSSLIAATLVAVAGFMAESSWRSVFSLYLVVLVAFVMALFFLPMRPILQPTLQVDLDTSEKKAENPSVKNDKKQAVVFIVVSYMVFLACNYLCTCMMGVEISRYLSDSGLGNASTSGLLMSGSFIGAVVGGLIVNKYLHVTKKLAVPIIFLFCSLGSFMLWMAPNVLIAGAGVWIIGLFASMMSMVVIFELSRLLPLEVFTPIAAVANMVIFLLQFTSPLVFQVVLIGAGSFRNVFGIYGVLLAIMMVISGVVSMSTKRAK